MAIIFGNNTSSSTTSSSFVTSRTFSHNNDDGAYNVLVVGVAMGTGANPTSVTYNGVAMTKSDENTSGTYKSAIYHLANAASGSNNVVVNFASRQDRFVTVIAQTLNNADESSPIGSTADKVLGGTTHALNHSGVVSGSVLIDIIYNADQYNFTPQDTQTLVKKDSVGSSHFSMYKKTSPSASQRTQYTTASSVSGGSFVSVEFLNLDPLAPTVATGTIEDLFETTGSINSNNVTDEGTESVTERGVVVNTSTAPIISDTKFTTAGTTGSYDTDMTSLSAGTHYYSRAFATNLAGTSYGSEVEFDTDEDRAKPITILDNPIIYS